MKIGKCLDQGNVCEYDHLPCESPGGDQVGGLPPATHAVVACVLDRGAGASEELGGLSAPGAGCTLGRQTDVRVLDPDRRPGTSKRP